MSAYEQRQQKAVQLCEKLMERIGEVAAPVPLGHWPPIADAPSAAFVIALSNWERDPSDLTMQRVTESYESVIAAWRQAGLEFTAEGSKA